MKISSVQNCQSFRGKIIDAHAHYGEWQGTKFSVDYLDKFVKNPLNINICGEKDTDRVEKMLVSSLYAMSENPQSEEESIKEALRLTEGKKEYAVLAVAQPNITLGNTAELEKAIDEAEGKVAGIKFHPASLSKTPEGKTINADDKAYDSYLELAEKKGLPCLFHSEASVNWKGKTPKVEALKCSADPKYIYELAKRHPDVPVILGHAGMGAYPAHRYAYEIIEESLKKRDAKLYADISWMDWNDEHLPSDEKPDVVRLIQLYKDYNALDRVLFGTDVPLGCYGQSPVKGVEPVEAYEKTVSTLKTVIKDNFPEDYKEITDKIFHDNAQKLFKLEGEEKETTDKPKKKSSLGAIAVLIGGAVALFAGIKAFFNKKKSEKTK